MRPIAILLALAAGLSAAEVRPLTVAVNLSALQLQQPELPGRDRSPTAGRKPVLGIGLPVTHRLEDHRPTDRLEVTPRMGVVRRP